MGTYRRVVGGGEYGVQVRSTTFCSLHSSASYVEYTYKGPTDSCSDGASPPGSL